MAEIVHLASARKERSVTQEVAWQRFVTAQEKAKASLRIEDGIAAGQAFRVFLETFTGKR